MRRISLGISLRDDYLIDDSVFISSAVCQPFSNDVRISLENIKWASEIL